MAQLWKKNPNKCTGLFAWSFQQGFQKKKKNWAELSWRRTAGQNTTKTKNIRYSFAIVPFK